MVTTKSKVSMPKMPASKQKASVSVLAVAHGDQRFWTNDGHILKDLVELRKSLMKMKKSAFMHHVTKEKNDFADWVEHVLKDKSCALALRKAKNAKEAKDTVTTKLKSYGVKV